MGFPSFVYDSDSQMDQIQTPSTEWISESSHLPRKLTIDNNNKKEEFSEKGNASK